LLARNPDSHKFLLSQENNTLDTLFKAMIDPVNLNNSYFQQYAKEFIKLIYNNGNVNTRTQIDNLLEVNNINKQELLQSERYSMLHYNSRWSSLWKVPLGTAITTYLLYPTLPSATKNRKYLLLLLGATSIPSIYYSSHPNTLVNIINSMNFLPLKEDLVSMPLLRSLLVFISTTSILAGNMFPYYYIGPFFVNRLDRWFHFTYDDYKWDEVNGYQDSKPVNK
jgi:hypothetical protein